MLCSNHASLGTRLTKAGRGSRASRGVFFQLRGIPWAARNTRVTPPLHTLCLLGGVAGGVLLFHGCGGEPGESDAAETPEAAGDVNTQLAGRLAAGDAIFGLFSGDHTAEAGAAMAATRPLDFVFYSLESGPFDIPALESYAAGMTEGFGRHGHAPDAAADPADS